MDSIGDITQVPAHIIMLTLGGCAAAIYYKLKKKKPHKSLDALQMCIIALYCITEVISLA